MSLIGRTAQLSRLQHLAADARLISVVGPAGAGKSRLVSQWLADQAWSHTRVSAGDAGSAQDLVDRVALALGVGARPGAALRRHQGWLWIDDVAPRLDLAPLLAEWLEQVPPLRIVVTTQAVLGLPEERLVEVGPLSLDDAVALYQARAGVVDGLAGDPARLAELVARLDRLPLTIELAAGRSRLMGPEALLDYLETDRFAVLGGTLRGTLDAHWAALANHLKAALQALVPFVDGAPLDGATGVLGADALDLLQGLRDQSLAWVEDGEGPRIRLYQTVRDHVLAQMDDAARAASERAHGAWFASRAEGWMQAHVGPDGVAVARRLDQERPNLRAIVERAARHAGDPAWSDIAHAVARLLHVSHYRTTFERHAEELDWALACTAGAPEPPLETRRLRARLLRFRGDASAAVAAMESLVDDARRAGVAVAPYLTELGRAQRAAGALTAAESSLREARATVAEPDRSPVEGSLGLLLLQRGRLAEARQVLTSSTHAARRSGDAQGLRVNLVNLAEVHRRQGALEAARDALQESLAIAQTWAHHWSAGYSHVALAELHLLADERPAAEAHLESGLDALQRAGDEIHEVLAWRVWGDLELARAPDKAAEHYARAGALADRLDIRSVRLQVALRRPLVPWPPRNLDRALAENAQALEWAGLDTTERHVLFAQRALLESHGASPDHPDLPSPAPPVARAYRGEDSPSWDLEVRFASLWRAWVDAQSDEVIASETALRMDGRSVDLTHRPLLATLLQTLVDARLQTPAQWVPADHLIEALWPGERLVQDAGRTRLYNAIAEIRRAGLRPLLQSSRAGYRLDPARPLRRAVGGRVDP